MTDQIVRLGPEYFPRPTSGIPVAGGSIYIGDPDTDPEIVGNQITVNALQENGSTVPIPQPILTGGGGVPLYNGAPVTLLVAESYSLKVLDSFDVQIYYVPSTDVPVVTTDPTVKSVEDILALINISSPTDDQTHIVLSFYDGLNQGGGEFYWDSSVDKATANGGTIIDPDNIGGFDGTTSTVVAYLLAQDTGVGFGCWIRTIFDNISPEMFGAVGDGTTDDTGPFVSAVATINDALGGTLELSPKTYSILWDFDVYGLHAGGFTGCEYVNVKGNGATLSIRDGARCGIFAATFIDEGYGLRFTKTNNIKVENITMNGNISNLDYSTSPVDDGSCNGIWIYGACNNVIVDNVICEEFGTDGFIINGDIDTLDTPDGITLDNCISDRNRRQGISVVGGENITVNTSKFRDTGTILGTLPQAGVDIEPSHSYVIDNVVFNNCVFSGNTGQQILHDASLATVGRVTYNDCVADVGTVLKNAVWDKLPTASFNRCKIIGSLVHGYGKYDGCELIHIDSAISIGSYALENGGSAAGTGTRFTNGIIRVADGIKPFFLETASNEEDAKTIQNTFVYMDVTSIASANNWATAKDFTKLQALLIIVSGTPPASELYLAQANADISSCLATNDIVGFSAVSLANTSISPGRTRGRVVQATRDDQTNNTISSGVIVVTRSLHSVLTEASAATDDLDTINGGVLYERLILRAFNGAQTVILKHATGNIRLTGSADFSLDNINDTIELIFDGTNWLSLSQSTNGL